MKILPRGEELRSKVIRKTDIGNMHISAGWDRGSSPPRTPRGGGRVPPHPAWCGTNWAVSGHFPTIFGTSHQNPQRAPSPGPPRPREVWPLRVKKMPGGGKTSKLLPNRTQRKNKNARICHSFVRIGRKCNQVQKKKLLVFRPNLVNRLRNSL